MTSIVIAANKSAVAIASDSRASDAISGVVYNDDSQKLFNLGGQRAAVIYGSPEIKGIPWRNIILNKPLEFGTYPLKRSQEVFDLLFKRLKSATEFYEYTHDGGFDDVAHDRIDHDNNVLASRIADLVRQDNEQGAFTVKTIKQFNKKHENQMDTEVGYFSLRTVRYQIERLVEGDFESRDHGYLVEILTHIALNILTVKLDNQKLSGVVFAGFNDTLFFPEIFEVKYLGSLSSVLKFKYSCLFNPNIGGSMNDSNDGYIGVFGELRTYNQILNGIDNDMHNVIVDSYMEITKELQACIDDLDQAGGNTSKLLELKNKIKTLQGQFDLKVKNRRSNSDELTSTWSDDQLLKFTKKLVQQLHLPKPTFIQGF